KRTEYEYGGYSHQEPVCNRTDARPRLNQADCREPERVYRIRTRLDFPADDSTELLNKPAFGPLWIRADCKPQMRSRSLTQSGLGQRNFGSRASIFARRHGPRLERAHRGLLVPDHAAPGNNLDQGADLPP